MKGRRYRIDWPVFIAALNLLAAVVVFVAHMLTHVRPWPGNAVLFMWVLCAFAGYALVRVIREEGRGW